MVRVQPQGPHLGVLSLAAIALGTVLCGTTVAALGAPPPPPVDIAGVTVGYGGGVPTERWCPLRVDLVSIVPWSGTLTIRYAQDATQDIVMRVPVSTTPGKTVPVEVPVCLPMQAQEVTLELAGPKVRIQRRLSRTLNPDDFVLPPSAQGGLGIVVIGESSAGESLDAQQVTPESLEFDDDARAPKKRASGQPAHWTRSSIPASEMPLDWVSYDGADVVIARAGTLVGAEARRLDALMAWVRAGGRLVLEVDVGGSEWSRFVPPGCVVADEVRPHAVPPALAKVLKDGGSAPEKAGISPVESVGARTLAVTGEGKALGWETIWGTGEGADKGLAASGPLGHGFVRLVGVDPAKLTAMVSRPAANRLWVSLLTSGARPFGSTTLSREENLQYGSMYNPTSSGATRASAGAIQNTLDSLVAARPVGVGAILVMLVVVGSLTLLLGPIDRVVLKHRRRLHRSWATALGWIGLASGVCSLIPVFGRSSKSYAGSVRVCDSITRVDDRGVLFPEVSAETVVRGVFANRPGQVDAPAPERGAWWRGVSGVTWWQGSRTTSVPIVLTPRAPEGLGVRVGAPESVDLSQWTYRTVLSEDLGPPAGMPVPMCKVVETPDGWAVEVLGLEPDATISHAYALLGGEWKPVTLRPGENGRLGGVVGLHDTGHRDWFFMGTAMSLPGTMQRNGAIAACTGAGEWACVQIETTRARPEWGPSGVGELVGEARVVHRVLARIAKGDGR